MPAWTEQDGEPLPATLELNEFRNLLYAFTLAANLVVSRAKEHRQAQSPALGLGGTRVTCTYHRDSSFISNN